MNTVERASAGAALLVIVFTAGAGWSSLNDRIDKVNEQITSMKEQLGSSACNAILPRQIEAIEKNRQLAREALERLSAQYDCGPHSTASINADGDWANAVAATNVAAATTNLGAELNAVDAQLNSEANNGGR